MGRHSSSYRERAVTEMPHELWRYVTLSPALVSLYWSSPAGKWYKLSPSLMVRFVSEYSALNTPAGTQGLKRR